MIVYTVSMDNQPLMPTHPAKARKLLKQGKATVVNKVPFTIKLKFSTCTTEFQPIKCGIDDGAKSAGISVVTERAKKNDLVVFTGTITVTNDIASRMEDRRGYRRMRRSRLRYRKPRFDNRTRVKCAVCGKNAMKGHETCRLHKGAKPSEKTSRIYWLPPSSKARKDALIRTVNKLMKWLPITKVVIETGKFDLQKLANPNISGKEYQQGPNYNRDSLKAALIAEYGRKEETATGTVYKARCCYCRDEKGPFEIEHIIPRSQHGKDNWNNLVIACVECNRKKGNRTPKEAGMELLDKPKLFHLTRTFVHATRLQQGKNYLLTSLRNQELDSSFTYGQYTSWLRKSFGISKTHYNDAIVIAVTTYDSLNKPKLPELRTKVYAVKPRPNKRRRRFDATCYSPNKPLPKGAGPEQMVHFGHTVKKLTEVNQACVLIKNEKGKLIARAVKTTEKVNNDVELIIRKGDYVKATRAGKEFSGRVSSLMSKGSIKIVPSGSKKQIEVTLRNVELISKSSNIIFTYDESHS